MYHLKAYFTITTNDLYTFMKQYNIPWATEINSILFTKAVHSLTFLFSEDDIFFSPLRDGPIGKSPRAGKEALGLQNKITNDRL